MLGSRAEPIKVGCYELVIVLVLMPMEYQRRQVEPLDWDQAEHSDFPDLWLAVVVDQDLGETASS